MKKVHTEVFCGKIIDVYREFDSEYRRYYHTAAIDGKPFIPDTLKTPARYRTAGLAVGGAKRSINLHMSKDDEIKKIEEQIAELQARLKELKG